MKEQQKWNRGQAKTRECPNCKSMGATWAAGTTTRLNGELKGLQRYQCGKCGFVEYVVMPVHVALQTLGHGTKGVLDAGLASVAAN